MAVSNVRILIADDDSEDLELIEETFQKLVQNAHIEKAGNGKLVLKLLSSLPDNELPGLIILDYNMPELNGPETLARLCVEERYSKIPVVILSTSNNPVYIKECLSAGAIDYFVKPNSMDELISTCKKMMLLYRY